ncbi:MAG: type II secretion system protein [Phycisphaerales bacterium]
MTRQASRRAFSLVELLVVIAIIALVISIILPALGGVRTAARRAATQTVMKGFSDAVGQFTLDNDRVPGIYSAEEMGSSDNLNNGMSAMENAILELAGGVVTVGGPGGVTASPMTQVNFGPTNAAIMANNQANRRVDVTRIGAAGDDNPGYFTIDPKFFEAQIPGQQVQSNGMVGHTADEGDPSIPDLVDAWGAPLLLWVENTTSLNAIEDIEDFVAIDSGTNGSVQARFYWASNAAFLRSDELGRERRNQPPQGPSDRDYSLISDPNVGPLNAASVRGTLAALLGSPAFPVEEGLTDPIGIAPTSDMFVPTQARGGFLIQSAGPDGYYMNRTDRGSRRLGGDVRYAWNFYIPGSMDVRQTGDDGNPGTVDLMSFFDDMTAQGGN